MPEFLLTLATLTIVPNVTASHASGKAVEWTKNPLRAVVDVGTPRN